MFGENLSVAGVDEGSVRIGDRWRWGNALLEVCQPRYPCYKLAMRHGRPDLPKRVIATGRTGWYPRVLQPGLAPTTGSITLVASHPDAATIREAHRAVVDNNCPGDIVQRVLCSVALSDAWRELVTDRNPPHQAITTLVARPAAD